MTARVKLVPDRYRTVTPCLSIRGAADAILFYKRAFGATEVMRLERPDGRVGQAELQVGDCRVVVADEPREAGWRSPQSIAGAPLTLHVSVNDADAVVSQAVAAGATLVHPVQDQFYGDRLGTVTDPYGHVWHVASHREQAPWEERRPVGRAAHGG